MIMKISKPLDSLLVFFHLLKIIEFTKKLREQYIKLDLKYLLLLPILALIFCYADMQKKMAPKQYILYHRSSGHGVVLENIF